MVKATPRETKVRPRAGMLMNILALTLLMQLGLNWRPAAVWGADQNGRTAAELEDPYDWHKDYQNLEPKAKNPSGPAPTAVAATPTPAVSRSASSSDDLFYQRYFRKGQKAEEPEELQKERYRKQLQELKRYQALHAGQPSRPKLSVQEQKIKKLIEQLGTDQRQQVTAIEQLVLIGAPAVPRLKKALHHRDKMVRVGALRVLRQLFVESALPDIETTLKDKSPDVRMEAAAVLGRFRHPETAPLLVPLLHDPKLRVRREAVLALGRLKRSPVALRALIRALENNVPALKGEAAQALSNFSGRDVVEALMRATHESDQDLVAYAVRSLGVIADPQSRPRLAQLAKDKNNFVAREAREALQNF